MSPTKGNPDDRFVNHRSHTSQTRRPEAKFVQFRLKYFTFFPFFVFFMSIQRISSSKKHSFTAETKEKIRDLEYKQ